MYRFNENSDVLEIEFVRVDDFNRPVFKPVDKRKKYFLADLSHLFDYDTKEEEIIKFYKDFDDLNKFIVFKGYSVDAEPEGNEIIKELRLVRKTKKNESKRKINEEYGEYKGYPEIEYIADKIEGGNQFGYEPYMFGSWELKAYFDGSDDLFARNSNLTVDMQDYLAREISYPVRDGHISYSGLDIIIHSGSGVSKEDLLSLDPNHDLFDEKDIDEMLNDESDIEFWIDYEVDYKEDVESDEEDLNESKIRIDEDVLKILDE